MNNILRHATLVAGAVLLAFRLAAAASFGVETRPLARPYLNMPKTETGSFPPLLSQTGAFQDAARLVPADCLIPYQLNFPFFSDGATKTRWASVPSEGPTGDTKIDFSPVGEWKFPNGTVFVKHFDLTIDETHPENKRRLETRLLVRDANGSVYGAVYKWRQDNLDADLLATGLAEEIAIRTASGVRTQVWNYPSRQDCRTCHTDLAGGVLGSKTRQLNGPFTYPNGVTDNQLRTWSHLGLFNTNLGEDALARLPALARKEDSSRSIEDRARSYLDANCAHCHRPGGTVGYFDARYDTPLAKQNLIDGPVLIDQGIDKARVIAPHDIWRSIAYLRVSTPEPMKMPPLAHERVDVQGLSVLRTWIESLPGLPVLAPPTFSAVLSQKGDTAEVVITHGEPGVKIRYTTDGSAPANTDPVYEQPIKVELPVVVRARAYKSGATKSIVAQQFFQPAN